MRKHRRELMMQPKGEDNPCEKLDAFTIIPDDPTQVFRFYAPAEYSDEWEEDGYAYYKEYITASGAWSGDGGKTWNTFNSDYFAEIEDYDTGEVKVNRPYINIQGSEIKIYCNSLTSISYHPEIKPPDSQSVCYFEVAGSPMSLECGLDYESYYVLRKIRFSRLFFNICNKLRLIRNPRTFLPATILMANYCYSEMFSACTSLENAPELPATSLTAFCYERMFYSCKALVNAPKELPATALRGSCYDNMFYNCTSLINVPELPAITLVSSCYRAMFGNCSKLNYIKALFTTTPSSSYTSNWVKGVSSTGTFVKNKDATWNVTGNNGIPSGWTVISE